MNGNGNGNGQKNRVRVQSVDTPDTVSYPYCVDLGGGLLLNDRQEYEEDGTGRLWTTTWDDVPEGAVIFRITKFSEGSGFWQPLQLPETQTDRQVATVEKMLRLHGLSLTQVVGKKQKWAKGGRHQ